MASEPKSVAEWIRSQQRGATWDLGTMPDRILDAVRNAVEAGCTQTVRQRYAARLCDAWFRPPTAVIEREVRARCGHVLPVRREYEAHGTVACTFHFALTEARSGADAAAHQRRIEADPACVASFGTLAETALERVLVWQIIDKLCVRRRGLLTVRRLSKSAMAVSVKATLMRCMARRVVSTRQIQSLNDAVRRAAHRARMDEYSIWTNRRDDHDEVLEVFHAVCREEGLRPRVKVVLPKEPIVQRRILLELAHEIGDERRELAVREWCETCLGEVSWHACIHVPRNGMDRRNFHAYVVYSQYPIERARHSSGEPSNRWTVELDRALPRQPPLIQRMWGNGPHGRLGTQELIRGWRSSIAEIQNRYLRRVGASKRYDARSYWERGIGVKGNGAVPDGSLAADRASTESRSNSGWQALDAMVAEMGAGVGVPVVKASLDEELCGLRLIVGLCAEEVAGCDEAGHLRRVIEKNLEDTQAAPVPVLLSSLRELRCRAMAALQNEPWLAYWQLWLECEPHGSRIGMLAADIVEGWNEAQARRYATDDHHEVRVLLAHARRHNVRSALVRQQLKAMRESDPNGIAEQANKAVERFVAAVVSHGLTLRSVTGPEDRRWLVRVRKQTRAKEAAETTIQGMRRATEPAELKRLQEAWSQRHGRCVEAMGDVGQELLERLEAELHVSTLRVAWRKSTLECEDTSVQRDASALMVSVKGAEAGSRERRAFEALPRGYRAEIARFAYDRRGARRMCEEREQALALADRVLAAAEPESNTGMWLELPDNADKLLLRLRFYDEDLAAQVEAVLASHLKRGERLREAGESMSVSLSDGAGRVDDLAGLMPTQVASWVGVDPEFLRHSRPMVWHAAQAPLRRFCGVVKSRITRIKAEPQSDDWDRVVADVVTMNELNAIECVDVELASCIKGARRRVEDAILQRLRRLHMNVAAIRATSDPRERANLRLEVEPDLVSEEVRDALSRGEWMRLARDAGLGRVGSIDTQVRPADSVDSAEQPS